MYLLFSFEAYLITLDLSIGFEAILKNIAKKFSFKALCGLYPGQFLPGKRASLHPAPDSNLPAAASIII
jgi:hypothetical protein